MNCKTQQEIDLENAILASNKDVLKQALSNTQAIDFELNEKEYRDNSPVPFQSSFFSVEGIEDEKDLPTIVQAMTEKAIKLGSSSIGFIDQYHSLSIRRWTGKQEGAIKSMYNTITQYIEMILNKTPAEGYRYVVYGINNETNRLESLFSLPEPNSKFHHSDRLYQFLNKQNKDILPVNSEVLKGWINNAYRGNKYTVQFPALSDKGSASTKVTTLKELKAIYGDYYKYKFSSPVILTNPMQSGIPQEHKGRVVLFYNKFPSKNITVDSLLKNYNGNDRTVGNSALGFIILNQNEGFKTVKTWIEAMQSVDLNALANNVKFHVTDYQAEKLVELVLNSKPTPEIENKFRKIYESKSMTYDLIDLLIREKQATRSEIVELIDTILQSGIKPFVNGIYINPALIDSNSLKNTSIGFVDTTNATIAERMDNTLTINDLNPDVVSLPAIAMLPDTDLEALLAPNVKSKNKTEIKEGVQKLFESNPELANAVYKALGFDTIKNSSILNIYNNTDISNADKNEYKINIDNQLYLDNSGSKESYFGYWMPIMYLGKNIGRVRFEEKLNKINGTSVKTFNPNIQIYDSKMQEGQVDYTKKGIGTKVHIALYKYVKSKYPTRPFVSDVQNTIAEIGLLKSLEKNGVVTEINPIGELSEKYNNYSTDEAPFIFNDYYFNNAKQIPSQQKQQAQQQYSQYLDTIFPNSKVKDIVYHGIISRYTDSKEHILDSYEDNWEMHFSPNAEEARIWALRLGKSPSKEDIVTVFRAILNNPEKRITSGLITNEGKVLNGLVEFKTVKENIHILGSKQDVEGFKNYIGNNNKIDLTDSYFKTEKGKDVVYLKGELFEDFKEFNISTIDLKNYIKNFITPLVFTEKSHNLSDKINAELLNKVKCQD